MTEQSTPNNPTFAREQRRNWPNPAAANGAAPDANQAVAVLHQAAAANNLVSHWFYLRFRVDHTYQQEKQHNTLEINRKPRLQRQLRMVCKNLVARWAKPVGVRLPRPSALLPVASKCVWGFGTAAAVLSVLSPAHAEGWTNAATASGWSNADRFTAETPRTNNRTPSVSFNAFLASLKGGELDQLMALISRAESPRLGYESVQHQARVKPPAKPTQLTLGQIFSWVKATPGQHHAIGRYQVIPSTLAHVSRELGFKSTTRYDRRTQDRIATFLIMQAGYDDFRKGRLSRSAFMDNLAAVWAGFPLRNGRSKYHGIAGNKATMTRAQFERAMVAIFSTRRTS